MYALFEAAFSPVNVALTAALLFVLVYWMVVILGFIDLDAFDVDVEMEADADVAAEGPSVGWFNHVLAFFNLADIPLMVFLTFWIVPAWTALVLLNDALHNDSLPLSLLLMVPVLLACLLLARFLTLPFVRVFRHLNQTEEVKVVGRECVALSKIEAHRLGQALIQTDGSPIRVNVRTYEGKTVPKGQTALVIEYLREQRYYLIEPL